jgi:hypothetical protein
MWSIWTRCYVTIYDDILWWLRLGYSWNFRMEKGQYIWVYSRILLWPLFIYGSIYCHLTKVKYSKRSIYGIIRILLSCMGCFLVRSADSVIQNNGQDSSDSLGSYIFLVYSGLDILLLGQEHFEVYIRNLWIYSRNLCSLLCLCHID